MNMGSSILGTRESLIVAYANLAPSGDHQWAIWDWKISSGRVRRKYSSVIITAETQVNSMAAGQQNQTVVSYQDQKLTGVMGTYLLKCIQMLYHYEHSLYCIALPSQKLIKLFVHECVSNLPSGFMDVKQRRSG